MIPTNTIRDYINSLVSANNRARYILVELNANIITIEELQQLNQRATAV